MVKYARLIIVLVLVAVAAVGSFAAVKINTASAAAGDIPTLSIEKSRLLNVAAKAKNTFMVVGSGFQPKQEIRLVMSQADGSLSDIGSVVKPATIKADDFGVWAASVSITGGSSYLNKKIAKSGAVSVIRATDASYNILATTAIAFYDGKADYKKWPEFAKAIIAAPKTTTPAKTTAAAKTTTPAKK